MGNKHSNQRDDEFHQMIKKIKQEQQNKVSSPSKMTINPEQKYLSVMIQKLSTSNIPEELKNKVSRLLHEKLTKEDLIKTVSIAAVLKNNQFKELSGKHSVIRIHSNERKTTNVKLNFNKINPYIKKNLTAPQRSSQILIESYEKMLTQEEIEKQKEQLQSKQQEQKINIEMSMKVLKQELRKEHSPFWKLNKIFADFMSQGFMDILSEMKSKGAFKNNEQRYQEIIRKLLNDWCEYLQEGCLYPYKKWLITFLEIPVNKLSKTIQATLLQEIFSINNSYLYHTVSMIISEYMPPLHIKIPLLIQESPNITPELFSIQPKLQIEGNFFISIFQMSELESIPKPQKILSHLELIKNNICKDIDEYHKLEKKGYFYQIDSDNILGIVNFILCRVPNKIQSVYRQMIFLRMVYGDGIYFTHGISSYMLSTIFGALQFLESQEFEKLLKENPLKAKTPISPASVSEKIESMVSQSTQEQVPEPIEQLELDSESLIFGDKQVGQKKQQDGIDQVVPSIERKIQSENKNLSGKMEFQKESSSSLDQLDFFSKKMKDKQTNRQDSASTANITTSSSQKLSQQIHID